MRSLNLDNLSATVPHPQVVSSMLPFLGGKKFGNPSSPHHLGEEPRRAVETARERMAGLLSALPEEILFTASGSESNNLAIKGILAGRDGRHIVTSAVEHMSVLHPIRTLSELGYRVTFLQVDGTGEVDPKDLRKSLKPDTALVSICHAIGEVGTVQPIHELASIAAERGIPFHSDAVLSAGVVPINISHISAAAISLSPQQFHGPKGVGVLWIRSGLSLRPLVEGGVQENGLRAGTENVAGIVGAGVAADLARRERTGRGRHLRELGNRLRQRLADEISPVRWTGHPTRRIPGHLSFCLPGVDGEAVLQALDTAGIAAATGSACASGALVDSYVLEAMGVEPEVRKSSLVFSFGIFNQMEDLDRILKVLPPIIERLRRISP